MGHPGRYELVGKLKLISARQSSSCCLLLKEEVNFLVKKGGFSGGLADSFNLINPTGPVSGAPLESNSLDSNPGSALGYLYHLELVASSHFIFDL